MAAGETHLARSTRAPGGGSHGVGATGPRLRPPRSARPPRPAPPGAAPRRAAGSMRSAAAATVSGRSAGGARAEQVRWERWGSPPGSEGPSASGDTPNRAVPPRVAALGAAPVPWRGAGGRLSAEGCPAGARRPGLYLGGLGFFGGRGPFPAEGCTCPLCRCGEEG